MPLQKSCITDMIIYFGLLLEIVIWPAGYINLYFITFISKMSNETSVSNK